MNYMKYISVLNFRETQNHGKLYVVKDRRKNIDYKLDQFNYNRIMYYLPQETYINLLSYKRKIICI